MIKKISIALVSTCLIFFVGYFLFRVITEKPTDPSVTPTSYMIEINDEYRFVQTSGKVCTFMKKDEVSGWEFIVEDAEYINWDDNYVLIKGYDKKYYVYSFSNNELIERDNQSDFEKLKDKYSIKIKLKDKNEFDHVEPV